MRVAKSTKLKLKHNTRLEMASEVTAYLVYEKDLLVQSESKVIKEYHNGYPNRKSNVSRERSNLKLANDKGIYSVRLLDETSSKNVSPILSDEDHQYFERYLESWYLDGRTVEEMLVDPELDATDKQIIIRKTIYCLGTLHSAGILMWDTHPSNFIVKDGEVYVCDFELSRSVDNPFTCPPPTSSQQEYFSTRQNRAIELDLATTGPNKPNELKSNRLEPRDDFYVFASQVLKLHESGKCILSTDLLALFKKIEALKFKDAITILREIDCGRTPPPGTPAPLSPSDTLLPSYTAKWNFKNFVAQDRLKIIVVSLFGVILIALFGYGAYMYLHTTEPPESQFDKHLKELEEFTQDQLRRPAVGTRPE